MSITEAHVDSQSTVSLSKEESLNSCNSQSYASIRRLANQKSNADKRLRELVFEIIGEYGKSSLRITRRRSYLHKVGCVKLILNAWCLQWAKFCRRLQFELYNNPVVPLDAMKYRVLDSRCSITLKVIF
jgi:hypothetical protein